MPYAQPDLPAARKPESISPRSGSSHRMINAVQALALLAAGGFLLGVARDLLQEFGQLKAELHQSQQHGVAGYLNIAPVAAFEERPREWYRIENNQLLLWFGFEKSSDHRWFRFPQGEIDPLRLDQPQTESISRPIDFPLVESKGGKIWKRIPSESPVVGYKIESHLCAYPVAILGKVLVINDIVDKHPYMILRNPFANGAVAYSIYDALLEGRRVTLAPTGYFQDAKPVLFDRGTESLWIEMHDGLTAMAGKHFRKRLMRVAIPSPVTWSTWSSQHPQSRLLVGADRSHGVPAE
jgi:hypothetical protein